MCKLPVLLLCALAPCLLAACVHWDDIDVPEKVTVKTDAAYAIPLGSYNRNVSEYFGSATILSTMRGSLGTKADVYTLDDGAGDDVMRYVVHYPIYDVPFDVKKYLDMLNLDDLLADKEDGATFMEEITIPRMSLASPSVAVPIAFPDSLRLLADSSGNVKNNTGQEVSIPMPLPSQTIPLASAGDCIKDFTIDKGSFTITVAAPSGWSGVTMELTSFSMGGSLFPGIRADDFTGSGTLLNKTAKLDGKKVDLSDGSRTITIEGELTLKIAKGATFNVNASSLTAAMSLDISTVTATANLSKLERFSVSDSSDNKIQLPEELIQHVRKISFGTKSGDKHYKHKKTGANQYEVVTSDSSTIGSGMGLRATIVNTLPAKNAELNISIASETFSLVDLTPNFEQTDANGNTVDWVQYPEVDFEPYYNDYVAAATDEEREAALPYVQLSISLPDEDITLEKMVLGTTYKLGISKIEMLMDWDEVAFSLGDKSTVSDVLDMSAFDLNNVLTNGLNDSGAGINSGTISNIEIAELPLYLYAQKPGEEEGETNNPLASLLEDIKLSGRITIDEVTDDAAGEKKVSVRTLATVLNESDGITFKNPVRWPDMADADEINRSTAPGVVSRLNKAGSSYSRDMAENINTFASGSSGNSMGLAYTMNLSGNSESGTFEIYSAMLEGLGGDYSTDIAIDMAVVLPLKMNITQDIRIPANSLLGLGSGTDMLSRDDDSISDSSSQYDEYVGYIERAGIRYGFNNNIMKGGLSLRINLNDVHSGSDAALYSGYSGVMILTSDAKNELSFTVTEAKNILTKRFNPAITVVLGQVNGMYVSRAAMMDGSAELGASMTFIVKMNGNSGYTIPGLR